MRHTLMLLKAFNEDDISTLGWPVHTPHPPNVSLQTVPEVHKASEDEDAPEKVPAHE